MSWTHISILRKRNTNDDTWPGLTVQASLYTWGKNQRIQLFYFTARLPFAANLGLLLDFGPMAAFSTILDLRYGTFGRIRKFYLRPRHTWAGGCMALA